VPRNFAAAVDVDDFGAVSGPLRIFGSLTGGIDALVFQEQEGVGCATRDHVVMNLPLNLPGGPIIDSRFTEAEDANVQHAFILRLPFTAAGSSDFAHHYRDNLPQRMSPVTLSECRAMKFRTPSAAIAWDADSDRHDILAMPLLRESSS
jgi:hypothetical protein